MTLAHSTCVLCKLPTTTTPTSTFPHKELQQEQDPYSTGTTCILLFKSLPHHISWDNFLGLVVLGFFSFSGGFFLLGECLNWVYGCCPGEPIPSAMHWCQGQMLFSADTPCLQWLPTRNPRAGFAFSISSVCQRISVLWPTWQSHGNPCRMPCQKDDCSVHSHDQKK